MGLCTANTPLRDSNLEAIAALETPVSAPELAGAGAAFADSLTAVAAAVPAASGSGAGSACKEDGDDSNAAGSVAAMLLGPGQFGSLESRADDVTGARPNSSDLSLVSKQ